MTECGWKCSKDEFGDSQKEWRKDVSVGFEMEGYMDLWEGWPNHTYLNGVRNSQAVS